MTTDGSSSWLHATASPGKTAGVFTRRGRGARWLCSTFSLRLVGPPSALCLTWCSWQAAAGWWQPPHPPVNPVLAGYSAHWGTGLRSGGAQKLGLLWLANIVIWGWDPWKRNLGSMGLGPMMSLCFAEWSTQMPTSEGFNSFRLGARGQTR